MATNAPYPLKPFGASVAASTPTKDTQPTIVVSDEFGTALRLLRESALGFAQSSIKDPAARAEYSLKIKAISDELIEKVMRREITPHQAALSANAMRNEVMEIMRMKSTDFGRTIATEMKAQGLTAIELQEKYARSLFKRGFSDLSHAQKESVWCAIVKSAGRSNQSVNMKARLYSVAGKTFLIATLAFAVYDVMLAQDKVRETAKQGVSIGSGIAAGVGVAMLIGSGPPGWVVGAGMFVAGVLAAEGSASAFDYWWPEQ